MFASAHRLGDKSRLRIRLRGRTVDVWLSNAGSSHMQPILLSLPLSKRCIGTLSVGTQDMFNFERSRCFWRRWGSTISLFCPNCRRHYRYDARLWYFWKVLWVMCLSSWRLIMLECSDHTRGCRLRDDWGFDDLRRFLS